MRVTIEEVRAAIAKASKDALPQIVKNARDYLPEHHDEIRLAHFARLAELCGVDDPDFERAAWATTEVFRAEQGRKVNPDSRNVRHIEFQMREHGAVAAHAKLVAGPVTPGFKFLVQRGMAHITAEALVVRFAHLFEPKIVERARARLDAID